MLSGGSMRTCGSAVPLIAAILERMLHTSTALGVMADPDFMLELGRNEDERRTLNLSAMGRSQ
jgi:hypothetical protein